MKKLFNKKIMLVLVAALVILGTAKVAPILGKTATGSTPNIKKSTASTKAPLNLSQDITKNETVYSKLDPHGNVKDTTVVNWFHFAGTVPESIDDPVALTNNKALNGSFVVRKTGTGVNISSLDPNRKDVYYSGQTQKKLPITLKIDYYLNGQAMDPRKLPGKTGEVKIVIQADNQTGGMAGISYQNAQQQAAVANKKLYTPLATMVSLDLPADRFSNVDAPDGLVTVIGETMKVNWMLFPYPSSTAVLTMHADDFELNSMSIIVQPKMPPIQDLDMEDKLKTMNDGISALDSALGELETGSTQLSSAQSTVVDGLKAIKDGLDKLIILNQAEEKVARGALEINNLLMQSLQTYVQTPLIGDKLKPVMAALEKQNDLLTKLVQGGEINGQTLPPISAGSNGLKQAQDGLDKLATGTRTIQDGTQQLQQGVTQIRQQGISKMRDGVAASLNELRMGQGQKRLMEAKVNNYDSFMGKGKGVTSRVQFYMQTEELK